MENKSKPTIEEIAEQFELDRTDLGLNSFIAAVISHNQDQELLIQELREKIRYDGKTGLERYEELYPALEKEIARANRHGENLSILVIDIDNFKRYNDSYGHLQGDSAIKSVAGIIKGLTRGEDTAVRYGGEEFCIVLPETSEEGAKAVAENLKGIVEKATIPKAVKDSKLDEGYKHVTVSIGGFSYHSSLNTILGFLDHNITEKMKAEILVHKADDACLEAKKTGKNRYTSNKME